MAWHYFHTVGQAEEKRVKFVSSVVNVNSVQMPVGKRHQALAVG